MTSVTIERSGGIGRIALNRPDQGNAIDMALARDLETATIACASDPDIRCVLLTGRGRFFCVGGDIAEFAAKGNRRGAFIHELATTLHRAVITLATMAKPLVVAVNGPAAGAGVSLAALGDIVLAARSSHFTAAYAGIGLTPDGGMSWMLPRLVGLRRAQEMMLTNSRLAAEDAAAIGLVTRAVDDEALTPEADAVAARLADGPVAALAGVRALLSAGQTRGLQDTLDAEAESIAAAADNPEGAEGVAAFQERRKPSFRR